MSATITGHTVFFEEIPVRTGGELDIVDISAKVRSAIGRSGVNNGIAHVFVAGQTAAVTTIEFESGAVADLQAAISRMAPRDLPYEHNARWGDGNGHSHIRAALLGPDITIPVRAGNPLVGTWQQVILVELDNRSRDRKIFVTVVGDRL